MLYLLLWPLVFATAYRVLRGDHGLAADAGQEVFFRLYRYTRFDDFAGRPEAFVPYVLAMCRNVGRDYLSKILREPPVSEDELRELLKDVEKGRSREADDPELAAIRSDELSSFLSSLRDQDRSLAELLLNGADTSEVAQALGLSYANAAVRIYRLRQLVRNTLKTQ